MDVGVSNGVGEKSTAICGVWCVVVAGPASVLVEGSGTQADTTVAPARPANKSAFFIAEVDMMATWK